MTLAEQLAIDKYQKSYHDLPDNIQNQLEREAEMEEGAAPTLTTTRPQDDAQVVFFYNEALKAREYALARVIATNDDLKPAADDLFLIRKLKKGMESRRKDYLQPFQEHIKETNDAFKTLMEPIETADSITSEKILAFTLKQKLLREEQEKVNALRIEASKLEMELKGELTESVNLIEVVSEPKRKVTGDMGTALIFKVRKWEVIDFALVPNDLKVIDAGKVTKLVKAGIGSISGLRIWEEDSLRSDGRVK